MLLGDFNLSYNHNTHRLHPSTPSAVTQDDALHSLHKQGGLTDVCDMPHTWKSTTILSSPDHITMTTNTPLTTHSPYRDTAPWVACISDHLHRSRSPVLLLRAGKLELHGFTYSLQNVCLPTPSRIYKSKEPDLTKLTSLLPREEGKCVCPLCGDKRPDSWYYATQCPFTEHLRQTTKSAEGNLLAGKCSLQNWDAVSMCNATKGSGVPDSPLTWDGSAEWPL
jgi:hypothetical protein